MEGDSILPWITDKGKEAPDTKAPGCYPVFQSNGESNNDIEFERLQGIVGASGSNRIAPHQTYQLGANEYRVAGWAAPSRRPTVRTALWSRSTESY